MEGSDRRELVSEPRRNPGAARPPCPKSTVGRPKIIGKGHNNLLCMHSISFLFSTFVYIYLTFINLIST